MVLTTSTDITFQKTTEETLRYRKALLEAHIAANLDGIILVDAKGKIISYNQNFIEIWNMPQYIVDASDDEAALNFAMSQLVNPKQFIEKVKYLYDHPKEISIDELEFKNGKIIERYGYPVVADDGTYYAWSWTFRDITEKKNIERELQESEAQFRQMADLVPAKITNADTKGQANYFNQNWLDYTGTNLEELKNIGWHKLVHPDDLDNTIQQWNEACVSGNDLEIELRFLNKHGEYKWHLGRAKAVKDNNGNIIKWLSILTEIQKIKDEEQRKTEFIKMVSHELKTPITSIKGYVQFLLKSINQEQTNLSKSGILKSSLSRIDAQVVRLTKLISEILDLSRLEESKLDLKNEWLNLKDLVDTTIQDVLHTNINVTIKVKHEISPDIYGDKDRIGQVFINLINNAIKYSPNSNLIEILVYQTHMNTVSVSIKDYGIGIDKKDQINIFSRFYRVEGKTETRFSGFGIGLFIVKEIVTRHNGYITVESEKGKGATFTLTLPISPK
jgi:PAS domain S-box-containing protein